MGLFCPSSNPIIFGTYGERINCRNSDTGVQIPLETLNEPVTVDGWACLSDSVPDSTYTHQCNSTEPWVAMSPPPTDPASVDHTIEAIFYIIVMLVPLFAFFKGFQSGQTR
jgi:hypothetical protein